MRYKSFTAIINSSLCLMYAILVQYLTCFQHKFCVANVKSLKIFFFLIHALNIP